MKTRTIFAIKDIKNQFDESLTSRIILLHGNRGSGKTTAMRYFATLIKSNADQAFLEVPVYLNINNYGDFEREVNKSILIGMKDHLQGEEKIGPNIVKEVQESIRTFDTATINSQIRLLFKIFCRYYKKRIIFIDNLDKPVTKHMKMIFDYFVLSQSFYEYFIKTPNTFIFIALQPFIGEKISKDRETAFFAGRSIRIRLWTYKEMDDLVEKKFERVYNGEFELNNFFSKAALN